MTTIVLVIIGILLAAAAALMLMFFGGDAFSSGDARAEAATAINAGLNIESAFSGYMGEKGRSPSQMSDLVSSGWLSGDLHLNGGLSYAMIDDAGDRLFTIEGLSEDACSNVNREFGGSGVLEERLGRRGCWDNAGVNTYFLVLSGAGAEAPVFEWFDGYREPDWSALGYTDVGTDGAPLGYGGTVGPNIMTKGDSFTSPNGRFTVRMQYDGSLALYDNGVKYWDFGYYGDDLEFRVQSDENIVLYGKNEEVIWALRNYSRGPSTLDFVMQDDGNLVVYFRGGRAHWASNTPRA